MGGAGMPLEGVGMIFTKTPIPGAFVVDIAPRQDERGFFSRVVCREEFTMAGLNADFVQCNMQHNIAANTLRGMHIQQAPHQEEKLVRCTRGAIFDVIVDLRPGACYGQWYGVELTADNHRMLYVPKGAAHGYVTLTPDTETFYMVTAAYAPGHEWGVRYDDPALAIAWPAGPYVMSDKDREWPLLNL